MDGTPARSPAAVVPAPPWWITAATCWKSQSCGTASTTSTLAPSAIQASDAGAKIATYEMLKRDQSDVKKAYDEILELVRRFTVSEDMTSDHVSIMERASGAIKEEPKGWFGKSSAKAATGK